MADTPLTDPPLWAQKAIWYQIFPERFRRGGSNNMPTQQSIKAGLEYDIPENWRPTSWTHDWYAQEEWAIQSAVPFSKTVHMRRYGGDLQGVLEKIPYLKELGITAVYFNPLCDAPSLHKYDTRHYHHIDVCFGNDREGDISMIENEDKTDPTKWVWTNADLLFLEVLKEMHAHGIKVIMDFSWNHTGKTFWAFKDLIKKGPASKFINWYEINGFDFEGKRPLYDGWNGIKTLPELKKIKYSEKRNGQPYEGNINPGIKDHIFEVCKRWMDPYGNGDVSKGIDGMRLDVAEQVPLGFWREFRSYTRNINSEFYLIGENWWLEWPDKLMDPEPWVRGDVFDGIMHYQWLEIALKHFNSFDKPISTTSLIDSYENLLSKYKPSVQHSMMNLLSSHDTERILSTLSNRTQHKFLSKPYENPNYYTGYPTEEAFEKLKILILHQFTFVGAPHIWNGDEMGMWGADDPDNRKPLIWPDLDFDEESDYFLTPGVKHKPQFNFQLFYYYKSLCRLRNSSESLQTGKCLFDKELARENILSYIRFSDDDAIRIIINTTMEIKKINIDMNDNTILFNLNCIVENDLILPRYSGIVFKQEA